MNRHTLFLKNRYNIFLSLLYIGLLCASLFSVYTIKENKVENYKKESYNQLSESIHNDLKILMFEKQNATLAIAMSLAQDKALKEALRQNDPSLIDLKKFSADLRRNTKFKNVWFQVSDKDGVSFTRSWTDKRGDSLYDLRSDVREMIANPHVMSTISTGSTGKFDMTFKSMVPIFDDKEFIGMFEVITHFNSIDRRLQSKGYRSVILVDEKYKKQLKFPFTKKFVGDYYVANLDADPTLMDILRDRGVESFLGSKKSYHHYKDKYLIIVHHIPDSFGNDMGYYFVFAPMLSVDMEAVSNIESTINLYSFILFVFLTIIFYALLDKSRLSDKISDKRYKTKLIAALALFFLLYEGVLYTLLYLEKESKIEQYLKNKTSHVVRDYNQAYRKYKDLSANIYESFIDTREITAILASAAEDKQTARQSLLKALGDHYTRWKKYNIKQLHFHLPGNESFLRFHRPTKHGDDLTGIRPTVEWVAQNQRPIDGFEEGRIYNGYRFVYPLFHRDSFIGSVEVSFSAYSMIDEFITTYNGNANLLMRKSVSDAKVMKNEIANYIQSPLPDFGYEESIIKKLKNRNKRLDGSGIPQQTLQRINDKILEGSSFSTYIDSLNKNLTFIPLKNPVTNKVVAAFIIATKATYIPNKQLNFKTVYTVLSPFMLFLLTFIYREFVAKHKLEHINELLEYKVESEVAKNRQKDQMITQQAKLAAMGEMIGAIAHQWRQPLNSLSINIENLEDDYDDNLIDKDFIDQFIIKQIRTIKFMSKTIDDFRNFFRIDKHKSVFKLNETIEHMLELLLPQLENYNITVDIDCDAVEIYGFKSEFQQVVLNLVNNAKDAIIENGIERGKISISADGEKLVVKDNAGGIPEEIINRIFEPYFTTKEEGKGTGMGLYMSKMIIEQNMQERLSVANGPEGAEFTVTLKNSIYHGKT